MGRKNDKSKKTNGIQKIDESRLFYPHLNIAIVPKIEKSTETIKIDEIYQNNQNSCELIKTDNYVYI